MPYDREFEDVYATIKMSVAEALSGRQIRCFRLDEDQPAGRITQRLLQELQSAAVCVADLTGSRPNVMWEVGYAMALGKPTLIVTQDKSDLHFDIHDMLTIIYRRNHLNETLGRPLKRAILDTFNSQVISRPTNSRSENAEGDTLVGELLEQIRELKTMMSQAVKSWNPPTQEAIAEHGRQDDKRALEGSWLSVASGSHLYAKIIENDLVVPYCYGRNDELTGVYYGWKRMGDYWFARFRWFETPISGFSFMKQESFDLITGAWWMDDTTPLVPEVPPMVSGVPRRLERLKEAPPDWAQQFFDEVQREGLMFRLTRSLA
jgi:hypothetical protein